MPLRVVTMLRRPPAERAAQHAGEADRTGAAGSEMLSDEGMKAVGSHTTAPGAERAPCRRGRHVREGRESTPQPHGRQGVRVDAPGQSHLGVA